MEIYPVRQVINSLERLVSGIVENVSKSNSLDICNRTSSSFVKVKREKIYFHKSLQGLLQVLGWRERQLFGLDKCLKACTSNITGTKLLYFQSVVVMRYCICIETRVGIYGEI